MPPARMAHITVGFGCCWYNQSQQGPVPAPTLAEDESSSVSEAPSPAPTPEAGRGKISSTALQLRYAWSLKTRCARRPYAVSMLCPPAAERDNNVAPAHGMLAVAAGIDAPEPAE
jgi:hypothetical protein